MSLAIMMVADSRYCYSESAGLTAANYDSVVKKQAQDLGHRRCNQLYQFVPSNYFSYIASTVFLPFSSY